MQSVEEYQKYHEYIREAEDKAYGRSVWGERIILYILLNIMVVNIMSTQ